MRATTKKRLLLVFMCSLLTLKCGSDAAFVPGAYGGDATLADAAVSAPKELNYLDTCYEINAKKDDIDHDGLVAIYGEDLLITYAALEDAAQQGVAFCSAGKMTDDCVDYDIYASLTKCQQQWINLQHTKWIAFSGHHLKDLRLLRGMSRLLKLDLSNNRIEDLSPLSDFTTLTDLNLSENNLGDLAPIKNMKSLKTLSLAKNQIMNLNALSAMKDLTDLDASFNQLLNINGLAPLPNLQNVNLMSNQIIDLSPLTASAKLRYLQVMNNPINYIQEKTCPTKIGGTALKAECSLAGIISQLPTDIPWLADATALPELGDFALQYFSPSSSDAISDFYAREMPKKGWTLIKSEKLYLDTLITHVYFKDSRYVEINMIGPGGVISQSQIILSFRVTKD